MTVKTSMRAPQSESSDEESLVHVFVQQMLVTRIFAATYTGRNYVHPLKDYRYTVHGILLANLAYYQIYQQENLLKIVHVCINT